MTFSPWFGIQLKSPDVVEEVDVAQGKSSVPEDLGSCDFFTCEVVVRPVAQGSAGPSEVDVRWFVVIHHAVHHCTVVLALQVLTISIADGNGEVSSALASSGKVRLFACEDLNEPDGEHELPCLRSQEMDHLGNFRLGKVLCGETLEQVVFRQVLVFLVFALCGLFI